MLLPSEDVTVNPDTTKEILTKACNILYGMATNSINQDLINVAFNTLLQRFPSITIQDVKNAFNGAEIDKKAYVSLTRDELLLPIKNYWTKKIRLLSKINEIEREENQRLIDLDAVEQFKQRCLLKFEQSKEKKEWIGTPCEAFIVLKHQKETHTREVVNHYIKTFGLQEKINFETKIRRENQTAKSVDLAGLKTEVVTGWLDKLQDPNWIIANEYMNEFFKK